jgi:NitT/TauT family transport system ATP-binding protein
MTPIPQSILTAAAVSIDPLAPPPRIDVRGAGVTFALANAPARTVLSSIDLQVRNGEFVSLLGPSGCGKTTLMNLMAGFLRPTVGTVAIDGSPVTGPDPRRVVIFQDYGLFPWRTVLGNVLFALESRGERGPAARDRARHYLQLVGLTDAADQHPHQLSGGMKQRVAIARALSVAPEVLFMDEPFGALDTFTRFHLQDLLLELWERSRITTVLVTHDVDEALYLSDRVVVLGERPGRIVETIDVALERPRDRRAPELHRLRDRLLEELRLAGRWARQKPEYDI